MALLPIAGNWIAATPIPDQTLETLETRLEGKGKEVFLNFARKFLRWHPEDRAPVEELFMDEWLQDPST